MNNLVLIIFCRRPQFSYQLRARFSDLFLKALFSSKQKFLLDFKNINFQICLVTFLAFYDSIREFLNTLKVVSIQLILSLVRKKLWRFLLAHAHNHQITAVPEISDSAHSIFFSQKKLNSFCFCGCYTFALDKIQSQPIILSSYEVVVFIFVRMGERITSRSVVWN